MSTKVSIAKFEEQCTSARGHVRNYITTLENKRNHLRQQQNDDAARRRVLREILATSRALVEQAELTLADETTLFNAKKRIRDASYIMAKDEAKK